MKNKKRATLDGLRQVDKEKPPTSEGNSTQPKKKRGKKNKKKKKFKAKWSLPPGHNANG